MVGHHDGFVDFGNQQTLPNLLVEWGFVLFQEETFAVDSFDYPLRFEFGIGFFLKKNKSPFNEQVRQRLLVAEIDEAVVMSHHLQVDRDKFLNLVKDRLDYFERKSALATAAG